MAIFVPMVIWRCWASSVPWQGSAPRRRRRLEADAFVGVIESVGHSRHEVVSQIARGAEILAKSKADGGLGDIAAFHALMLLIRTGRRVNEVLMMDFDPLFPLVGGRKDSESGLVARMRYQQTKVQSGQPNSIPVDAEIVAIIRAQQDAARGHMSAMGRPGSVPRYLFLRRVQNRNGQHPYSAASLHAILGRLSEKFSVTDSRDGWCASARPTGSGTPRPRPCSTRVSPCMW